MSKNVKNIFNGNKKRTNIGKNRVNTTDSEANRRNIRRAERPGDGESDGSRERKRKRSGRFGYNDKLTAYYLIVLLAFVILVGKLFKISMEDGERYKKIVLSQQTYNSTDLPYKRGSIVDCNGIVMAHSVQVYNLILDCSEMNKNSDQIETTLVALNKCFGIDANEVRSYMRDNPESAYHILLKSLTSEEIQTYLDMVNAEDSQICKDGVWFEDDYIREYPLGCLAADVIGFTTKDGFQGQYGLEEYYNDVLSGVDGRTYGYRTEDYGMEYNVIPATNGYTIESTIDTYIQQICEENLAAFNAAHAGEFREEDDGSDNTAVIVMDIDSGEVLAMASYPFFNLQDPYDLSMYYTDDEIALMQQDGTDISTLNELWKNFCISQSYEPGSVCKTFTVAAGLDSGSIHDGDTYNCNGYLTFGEGSRMVTIRCHNRYGEGLLTVKGAIEQSCNVCLMQIGERIGAETFLKYFGNFNFGLKTNIDLAGEMRTDSLVFTEDTMGVTELATSSFGQGYNVTMIQVINAYCSLINGGYLYQPHMVKRILDDSGATVQNIDPVMLRQTVSETTSDYLIDYCIGVVDNGTGKYARPAGYKIGGKTGTAEHSGAGKVDYVVSFIGFAPADNPQIAIYVVIDRPNTPTQDTATRYACLLTRDILTDVLPYMNIYMTEPLSEEERAELEERGARILMDAELEAQNAALENDESVSGNGVDLENQDSGAISTDSSQSNPADERVEVVIDPETGYAIDPLNGEFLDPETGVPINGDTGIFQDAQGNSSYGGTDSEDTETDDSGT